MGALNPWLPVRSIPGQPIPSLIGKALGDDVVEYQRPWGFPDRTNDPIPAKAGNYIELPFTIAGPDPTNTTPDLLLNTTGLLSNPARQLYQDAGYPHDTDVYSTAFVLHQGTNKFDEDRYRGTNTLGDPVNFSAYLVGQIVNNSTFRSSFNLDADSGYGHLAWDWRCKLDPNLQPTDGQNHVFVPPIVWPEGADNKRWTPLPPTTVPAPGQPPNTYSPELKL